jgi:large subunit ribosomal protein L7/L12
MARAKVIIAGILLGTGLAVGLLNTAILLNRNATSSSRFFSTVALMFFGLPSLAIGSKLVLKSQDEAKQEQNRLQTTFYRLLKANGGKINVLQLAVETKISGTDAKAFLDDQAKEFNARFEVSEDGKVFYDFDLGADANLAASNLAAALLSGEATYDVILEKPDAPWDEPFWGSSILSEVERCVDEVPAKVRKRIKGAKYPVTIAKGLSEEEAKNMRKSFRSYHWLNVEIQPTDITMG